MKAFYLELLELDKELFNELIKDIVAFSHEPGGLLFGHLAGLIEFRGFEVRKEKNEHFLITARDLDEVDVAAGGPVVGDLVKISIEDLPLKLNALIVIANIHWGRSLSGY